MDKATVDYILTHFNNLMNEKEHMAWTHWASKDKTDNAALSQRQQNSRKKILLKQKWMTNDTEVLELLKNGIDEFRLKTATRISIDNPNVLNNNKCPSCGKLPRTPFAKQCHHCFHDWH